MVQKQGRRTRQELEEVQEHIAEELKTQRDEVLACRGLMHAWEAHPNFRIVTATDGSMVKWLRRDLECMRGCGVVRHETFLLNFTRKGEPYIREKMPNTYSYPKDYKLPGTPRGVKRSTIIYQETFRRAMDVAMKRLVKDIHPENEEEGGK